MSPIVSLCLLGVTSCDFATLPRLPPTDEVVSLTASPSVFLLHRNDTRETTLTLSNGTRDAFDVPSELTISGLVGGTIAFSQNTCAAQLAAGESCTAIGTLLATASGKTTFQIALGTASASLT